MVPLRSDNPARPVTEVNTGTHLPLSGEWALWSEVAVRSAGFTADGVLRLSAPALAHHADGLVPAALDDPAWQEFRRSFARAAAEAEAEFGRIAADPRFRAALTWQNHHVIDRAVEPLLRREPSVHPRNSRHRQREDLVASYWQRYCVKNDTIGSFGPVGWVRASATRPTTFRPSSTLIDSFDVFFESWALDFVAKAMAEREGMAEWLAPRRVPFVRVEGNAVLLPRRPAVAVPAATAAALRRCDGVHPASVLAAELVAAGHAASRSEAFAILAELRKRRWIEWTLDLPALPRAEDNLRARLAEVAPAALREQALGELDALVRAKARIRAAVGDPSELRSALRALDDTFATITGGRNPTRNAGKAYGGRTLVYHDARRRVDLVVGAELLDALAPVDTILTSARWFTYTISQALSALIRTAYDRLRARGSSPVDLGSLWFECMSVVHGRGRHIVRETARELQRRWSEILGYAPEAHRVTYRAEEVRHRVLEQFSSPHCGWSGARHVSPDIMVAARDIEAIRRGDFEVVLAETHLAIVAYRHFCFVTQHPEPARLFDCLAQDAPAPRLIPVLPKDNRPRLTIRTHSALVRDEDFLVALYHQTADPRRPRLLMSADLAVEPRADRLVTQLPTGEVFNVLDCFSEMLLDLVIDALDIIAPASHTPRITIDRLVIHRETWRFPASALDFATDQDEARRYVRAREWRLRASLPEHIFVTSPLEQKPYFIDLSSIAYVNLLAKAIRRAREADPETTIKVAEMLPTFDQLWLTDADGGRYTSELRLIAVNLHPVPLPETAPAQP
jgi:hypothetical protein